MSVKPYWGIRNWLRVCDGVPLYDDRTIVPQELRPAVIDTLHSAHQGVTGMTLRAGTAVFWPGITPAIQAVRDTCWFCQRTAPTQPKLPPVTPVEPQYPFEHICMDYMSVDGKNYGVFVDRYTNLAGVYTGAYAADVETVMARLCEDYGVPVTCTTDGGPQYTAALVKRFMADYGIYHRLCSVANPHANTRAELAVKTVKRMIRDCRTIGGKLDTAKFSQAMLQYRNTPDRDTGLSPATALFGRPLRDFLPRVPGAMVGQMWRDVADAREQALRPRGKAAQDKWSVGARKLPALVLGDNVLIQNQSGNHPRRWDKHGVVVEVLGFDQYQVRVEGSRRLTLRNRMFLRKYTRYQPAAFVTIPASDREQVRIEPEGAFSQAGQVRRPAPLGGQVDRQAPLGGPDGGVMNVPGTAGVTVHGHREVQQPACLGDGGPAGGDLHRDLAEPTVDEQPAAVPGGDGVVGAPELSPVRRSSRSTRGVTDKYKDFVRYQD